MHEVNLTYFKSTGKYYSEGTFTTSKEELSEIFTQVKQFLDDGMLPGLCEGAREFFVLISVPGHPHDHPHLCIPPLP
jgi:hypothetical protein